MQRPYAVIGWKLFLAVLAIVGVVGQLIVFVQHGEISVGDFFSYFTIQSNTFNAIVLIIGAYGLYRGQRWLWLAVMRGAAAVYMIVTGIIFAVLLADFGPGGIAVIPWTDLIIHYWLPVAALIDWVIDPVRVRLSYRWILVWLLYPPVYLGYSLIRGAVTGWYPYEFVNPARGIGGIVQIAVEVVVLGLIIGAALIWISRRQAKDLSK